MIKAEQIRKITKKVTQERLEKALTFIKNEWETFIEPRIQEAANNGKYSISYFWSKEILQDLGITVNDTEQAIRLLGEVTLGFSIGILDTLVNFEVEISW